MRWPVKAKPKPRENEIRQRVKFAWFPVKIGNVLWLWLERYRVTEVYSRVQDEYAVGWKWQITDRGVLPENRLSTTEK